MSMTREEMAVFIKNELGVFDDFSVNLIYSFLDKEYRMLWDKYPFKDTQMSAYVTVTGGSAFVDYPDGMDRVITVRITDVTGFTPVPKDSMLGAQRTRFVDSVDSSFLIESEPDLFEQVGRVKYYEEAVDMTSTPPGAKRLRLYPIPERDATLYILGKAQCPGLKATADRSIIRNLDNAIICYAYYDFLQRQRQYAKAAEKLKEATAQEQVAVAMEQQQANQPRKSHQTTVKGNSLSEMVYAVCMICGQWTPEYRQMIREFLRRNYQALYDLQLWPESRIGIYQGFTFEQVILPEYVDKVLGIRGRDGMRMSQQESTLILDLDPMAFEEFGHEMSYDILTPVAVSTLPGITTPLTFASTSPLDIGKVFVRGESGGKEIYEEIRLDGTNNVSTIKLYDTPLTIAKDITVGDVTVNALDPSTGFLSLEVIPADKREMKHQRLWFLPRPDNSNLGPGENFTCLIFAKRKITPLLTDQDTPIITGAEATLIAAAAADTFRKLGQADQATAFQQKADAAAKALQNKNENQQAHEPRFVPEIETYAYNRFDGIVWAK